MPDGSGLRTIDVASAPVGELPPHDSDKLLPDAPLQVLPCGDSLALFRRLFSHSGDAALLTRPNGLFLAANTAACALFRMSEADLLERSREGGHRTLADAADPRLDAAIEARTRDGSARAEIRLRRVNGELFEAEVSSVLFLDEGAEPTSLMTVRDVSAQRSAERTLQVHEERLEFALDAAAIGDWETDLRASVTRHSLRHDQCFGYAEGAPNWDYDIFLAHVHPEDREHIYTAFRNAMSGSGDYEAEFRVVWADGSVHWLWNKGRCYFDEAGEPLHMAGIVTDISARRRAAAALDAQTRRHERMLTSALAAMQDFAHIYDRDGRFLFVNQALLDLWQMDLEQVIGRNFAGIGYPPELAARLQAEMREVIASKSSLTGEAAYTGAAGVPGWYEYIFSPVLGADGRVDFVVGTTRDVTERIRNTQAMAASAAEFRILAESMPQIVWVARPDGWHVHFNQHWMDYTGLSLEASLGHGWNPPFHPEDRERAAECWRQATESGEPYEIEYRLRRADGIYHWMLGRALPLRDSLGTIVKWFGTCTDIDELKQAQLRIDQSNRALLDSEQRYRSLFEQNADGVYSLDRAGRIVAANQAFLSLIGYAAEEALSMDFLHYVAADCVVSSAACFRQALAGEPVHYESVRLHQDGRRVEVEVSYQPLLVDGAIAGVHGIIRDITQRKRATELLHRQQEFLSALIENVTDGIVACDADGSVTLSNRAVRDFRAREFEPPASGSQFEPAALYLADGITPMSPGQMPWLRALHDGSVRDAEVLLVPTVGPSRRLLASGQALYDADGRKTGAVVAMRDITAERLAQDAIRTQAHMLDSIGQAVIATDLAGIVIYLNRFAESLYGWTSEEALGRSIVDIASADTSRLQGQDALAELRNEAGCRGEFRARRRDGGEFSAAVTVALLRDRDGNAIGMVGVSEDISERQQIQEALSRQNALLANAQRVAGMGVWELDVLTRHLVWSAETHRIFGVAPAGFDNSFEGFLALVHPDDARRMRALYDAPLTPGASLEIEYRIRRPNGEERVVFERGEVVCDDAGRPVRKSGVVMDVTERRREQDALRELNAGLEERVRRRTLDLEHARELAELANRAKSSFLATMSHEIRTPMNGVIGMIDVLEETRLQPSQRDMVKTARESAYALLAIVDDVLDFSKIEAGQFEIDNEPLDVATVVEGVCDALRPLSEGQGAALRLYVDPRLPPRMLGDAGRLRQVLINLVGNAIKFSSRLTRPGSVSLRALYIAADAGAGADDDTLALVVTDNGVGIDSTMLGRLFSPFTQADNSTTRRYGGTGLGLSISQRLVASMGGEISARSLEGQGSTFTVRLPMRLPPTGAIAAETPATASLAGLPCVLFGAADPAADQAADLASYLTHAGCETQIAPTLAAGLEGLRGIELGRCIVVVANPPQGVETVLEACRDVAALRPGLLLAFVVIEAGRRHLPRRHKTDQVGLDGECLRRAVFLRGVAIAAGLEAADDDSAAPSRGESVTAPLDLQGRADDPLILVAEDNEINQKVLTKQLALLGYRSEMVGDGVEALGQWRRGGHALLLTDLHMPAMDGYKLAAAVRAEEGGGPRLPIIALTANALRDEELRCRQAGMDGYLTKPVRLTQLKAAIDGWLRTAPPPPVVAPPPQAAAPVEPSPADLDVLAGLIGDDPQVMREVLVAFRANSVHSALELAQAQAGGAVAAMADIAHKLKSAARAIGAVRLGQICADIEEAARGSPCGTALGASMTAFDGELPAVHRFVDAHLDGNA